MNIPMQKTKIICTIGPASDNLDTLRELINSGMNVARINCSHGTQAENLEKIDMVKSLREEMKVPVAILLDTKGPEIRVKTFADGRVDLVSGNRFTLTTREVDGTDEIVSVSYPRLPANVCPGTRVMLDDGMIELVVETVEDTEIHTRIVNGGPLTNRKSLNLPGVSVDMPFVSEADRSDLEFGYKHDVDYIALSFVRSADDVLQIKQLLATFGEPRSQLISKIENAEGVANIDEIIRESDGIMVARGDMGVEIAFEELPDIQKTLINKCYRAGKKVITATQMLESMINSPPPPPPEVTDIANAIYDGTSAIMLSGETANGKYPVESLRTMAKIALKTEENIDYKERFKEYKVHTSNNITDAISHATCSAAHDLGAVAILTVTVNGTAARMISRYRPDVKIIAVSPKTKTYYQMAMNWGVVPLLGEYRDKNTEVYENAFARVLGAGLAKEGDLIVITGSSSQQSSITDMLKVQILGDIAITGVGHINTKAEDAVVGRAHVISTRKASGEFVDGSIIVIDKTTPESLRLLRRAKAVVTEEMYENSGIAAAAFVLDIPVISNAVDATKIISDGSSIKVDPVMGMVRNI